ncbi:hypothetical protein ACFLTT_01145 [Chloroflexota bacterium]
MIHIELEPELDACVETQAKKKYNQILGELLNMGGASGELTLKLEMLRLFLETADFNKLRSESEKHLQAGKEVKFILHLEQGKPVCDMEVT